MNFNKIVIVGFGNMGKSIAHGIQYKYPQTQIYACGRQEPGELKELPDGLDIQKITYLNYENANRFENKINLSKEDVIIFCVKPQSFIEAAAFWKKVCLSDNHKPFVISIMAGVPTNLIHKYFDEECPVVRCMPNIAATINYGATALCASEKTPKDFLDKAKTIFDSIGKTWIVHEEQLDAVTGLSGSGPAYIYMIIEALSDGGVKMGLPRQLALDLSTQTVLGAAKLVQETKIHPAVLRDQVTTPGGTTICAIHELEKHGLRPMLIQAVVTATEKSAGLSKVVEEKITKK
jgi:pyrroline-5-carboxylate reductase